MAFAHYTYHASKKNFMILDLQGVFEKEANAYVLSDPAFVSLTTLGAIWGPTDLGNIAIKNFV